MDQDAEGLPGNGDVVDRMQREWARLRPDLSFSSLGVIHRVLRASRLILSVNTMLSLQNGDDPRTIVKSWQQDLDAFKKRRATYLLY